MASDTKKSKKTYKKVIYLPDSYTNSLHHISISISINSKYAKKKILHSVNSSPWKKYLLQNKIVK